MVFLFCRMPRTYVQIFVCWLVVVPSHDGILSYAHSAALLVLRKILSIAQRAVVIVRSRERKPLRLREAARDAGARQHGGPEGEDSHEALRTVQEGEVDRDGIR